MHHDDNARNRRIGIGLVTLTTLCFATLDACAKWLVHSLPVVEVVWLRFTTHVLITSALLAPVYGRELISVRRPGLQALRALMLGSMTALNFWALQYLQLAETGAIQFSVPLLIALISAFWLGEKLDAKRWLAIAVGFAGVLLVIRPGGHGFHPALLLSVVNAFIYAAFNLLTRRMAATESAASMQLMSALGAVLLLAPFALGRWQWPAEGWMWGLVAAMGFCGGMGHYLVAKAHRYASAAVLGPFLYQQIVYMTLWGWLLFSQVPDVFVIAGAAVVVSSGLYLLWLEVRGRVEGQGEAPVAP
ncbi:MAG: Riboflavin transporter [Pseudomonadota bacterium]|jgi:drug/metabolite transporter (DMT)-like permease